MRKRLLAASLCAVMLIGALAPRASADIGDIPTLLEILRTLYKIQNVVHRIREAVATTRNTLERVYPLEAIQAIQRVFDEVGTIQDEIRRLSCDWQFSFRTQRLWEGLFKGARFCRRDFHLIFGPPPEYVLGDLDEYQDHTATRRLNMVATRVERGPRQQQFFRWLLEEAEKGRVTPDDPSPYGPGYSQRLSAVGAAALGNVILEEGDTLTAQLELAQERANDRRLKQKLGTELALDLYARLGGGQPASSTRAGALR